MCHLHISKILRCTLMLMMFMLSLYCGIMFPYIVSVLDYTSQIHLQRRLINLTYRIDCLSNNSSLVIVYWVPTWWVYFLNEIKLIMIVLFKYQDAKQTLFELVYIFVRWWLTSLEVQLSERFWCSWLSVSIIRSWLELDMLSIN